MEQAPGKRTAAAITAPSLDLSRMWQGDLAEPLAAFLPLNSIGAVGTLSRRCRDRLPAVFFNLARKHGTLRGSMTGFVDAIRATGRDDSLFSGEALESWVRREPNEREGSFTAGEVTIDGSNCIKILTSAPSANLGHNIQGGLMKEFDVTEKLCARQVKYRFCFRDLDPGVSHTGEQYEHGFAFFTFGPYAQSLQQQRGLLVEPVIEDPVNTAAYQLTWWDQGVMDDGSVIMRVKEETWYDVTMTFDWRSEAYDPDCELAVHISVTGEDGSSRQRMRIRSSRVPITSFGVYNYSASVSHYSAISVRYSKHTPHDGILDDNDDTEV